MLYFFNSVGDSFNRATDAFNQALATTLNYDYTAGYNNAINRIKDLFSVSVPNLPKVPEPIAKLNFDVKQLIPSEVSKENYPAWISAYLKNFPDLGALLWQDNQILHLSYLQNNQIFHVQVPGFTVDLETLNIVQNNINASLKDMIASLKEQVLPQNLKLIDADKLSDVKFKVQLAQKFISQELITYTKSETKKSLDNLESSASCSICFEDFTDTKPPFLVKETTSVYHKDCLVTFAQSLYNQQLRDPKTRKILATQANSFNADTQLVKDEAYLVAVHDVKNLKERTEQMTKMLEVLSQENATLKAKTAGPT